ncbi:MAG: hypothetical protein AAFX93_11210 [Verrucomicrobiota bacterium]
MTNLSKLIEETNKKDRFWVAIGDNVLDEPQSVAAIRELHKEYSGWEILVAQFEPPGVEPIQWALVASEECEDTGALMFPGPIQSMLGMIDRLKDSVAHSQSVIVTLREYVGILEAIDPRRIEMEERERRLHESEEALMTKAQELEILRVELEHKQESGVDHQASQLNT